MYDKITQEMTTPNKIRQDTNMLDNTREYAGRQGNIITKNTRLGKTIQYNTRQDNLTQYKAI